jgi:hypothetical protein
LGIPPNHVGTLSATDPLIADRVSAQAPSEAHAMKTSKIRLMEIRFKIRIRPMSPEMPL